MGKRATREKPPESDDSEETEGKSANPGEATAPDRSLRAEHTGHLNRSTASRSGRQATTNGTRGGDTGVGHGSGYIEYEHRPDRATLSARYGLEVRRDEAGKLQRLESEHGSDRVQRWVDEGMTVDTMGKPRDMQAFRERQESRSDQIPADVERRTEASRRRNVDRNQDSPAGDTGVPDAVRRVVSSPGQSMDETVQREMESKMGGQFDDVQIHTGPQAQAAADSINARAFTVGNNVAFNRGEYDPASDEGKKILAHELTHVRQQTDGRVSLLSKSDAPHPASRFAATDTVHIQPKLEVSSPDDPAEKEAREVAERVVEMDSTDPNGREPERVRTAPLHPVGARRGHRERASEETDGGSEATSGNPAGIARQQVMRSEAMMGGGGEGEKSGKDEGGATETVINQRGEKEEIPQSVAKDRAQRMCDLIKSQYDRLVINHRRYVGLLKVAKDHPVKHKIAKTLGWGYDPSPDVQQDAVKHFNKGIKMVAEKQGRGPDGMTRNFFQAKRQFEEGLEMGNKYANQVQKLDDAIQLGSTIAVYSLMGVKTGSKIAVGVIAGVMTGGLAAAAVSGGYSGAQNLATQFSKVAHGMKDAIAWGKVAFVTVRDIALAYVMNGLGNKQKILDSVKNWMSGGVMKEFGEEAAEEIMTKLQVWVAKGIGEAIAGGLQMAVKKALTAIYDSLVNADINWGELVRQVIDQLILIDEIIGPIKQQIRDHADEISADVEAIIKMLEDKKGQLADALFDACPEKATPERVKNRQGSSAGGAEQQSKADY